MSLNEKEAQLEHRQWGDYSAASYPAPGLPWLPVCPRRCRSSSPTVSQSIGSAPRHQSRINKTVTFKTNKDAGGGVKYIVKGARLGVKGIPAHVVWAKKLSVICPGHLNLSVWALEYINVFGIFQVGLSRELADNIPNWPYYHQLGNSQIPNWG